MSDKKAPTYPPLYPHELSELKVRRERIRALVLALLHDGRTYEPFAYADVVALAIQYDNKIEGIE